MQRERDKTQVALEILLSLISLAGTAWIVWIQLPPAERQMTRLSMASAAHKWLARAARRIGYLGMGDELAGRDPSERYGFALMLGKLRDRIEDGERQARL